MRENRNEEILQVVGVLTRSTAGGERQALCKALNILLCTAGTKKTLSTTNKGMPHEANIC